MENLELERSAKQSTQSVDWWMGTVVFAFFPFIASLVIFFVRNGYVDLFRIIGNGELILSAFVISAPTVFKLSRGSRGPFYASLLVSFLLLATYASMKTNEQTLPNVVYSMSVISVFTSILVTWLCEKTLWRSGHVRNSITR